MSLSQLEALTVEAPKGESGVPNITVNDKPFSVDETVVETLTEGDGEVIPDMASVTVDYHGVNGRTGEVFDSSWKRGEPVGFPLNGVVRGFAKAIAGQKVGSEVVVAMTSDDGYGDRGAPAAGIKGGDTLIFFIKIHAVN